MKRLLRSTLGVLFAVLAGPALAQDQTLNTSQIAQPCSEGRLFFGRICHDVEYFRQMTPRGQRFVGVTGSMHKGSGLPINLITRIEDHTLIYHNVLPKKRRLARTGNVATSAAQVSSLLIDRYFHGYEVASRITATRGSYNDYARSHIQMDIAARQTSIWPQFQEYYTWTQQNGLNGVTGSWASSYLTRIECKTAKYLKVTGDTDDEGCDLEIAVSSSTGLSQQQCADAQDLANDLVARTETTCGDIMAVTAGAVAIGAGYQIGTILGAGTLATPITQMGGASVGFLGTGAVINGVCPTSGDLVYAAMGELTGCWTAVTPSPVKYLKDYVDKLEDMLMIADSMGQGGMCTRCLAWRETEEWEFDDQSGEGVVTAGMVCDMDEFVSGTDENVDGVCDS